MKALVDDMLSLARTGGVISKGSYEIIDYSAVLNNSVLIYEPIVFDGGKRLEYVIQNDICVMGDSARLHQLIEFLLDNACKYSPPAGLITVYLKSGNKKEVCLEVTNEAKQYQKRN